MAPDRPRRGLFRRGLPGRGQSGDDRAARAAHPDFETLADLDAGLLDPATADKLAAHVAGCPHCRAATRALEAVRTDLAALPTPALPDTVAARLDATLADLAPPAGRHAPSDGHAHTDRHTPTDRRASADRRAGADRRAPDDRRAPRGPAPVSRLAERRRRRERLMRRVTSVAAGLVAVAIAGLVTTSVLRGGRDDDSGGAGTVSSTQGSERLEDHGGGTFGRESDKQPAAGGLPAYDRQTLATALPAFVAVAGTPAAGTPAAPHAPGPAGDSDLAAAEADVALRDRCAASVPGAPSERPSAFRAIRFEGVPAFVLVYDENDQLSGYVVGSDCGRVTQATVLYRVPA